MARSSASQTAQVTSLAPAEAIDDGPQLLYRPVLQGEEPPAFKMRVVKVAPETAQQWLREADADPDFRNRPTRLGDVRRWRLLMETRRFVHWLPEPILRDESKILINGKHRMTALAGFHSPVGFVVIENVPRWMAPFISTGRNLSLSDAFAIVGQEAKGQTGAALRLALRFEEYLFGKRSGHGWAQWRGQRDEHADVVDFLARREPLVDLYGLAAQCARSSRLMPTALMVFRFYQECAWPDGVDELREFWDGLSAGAMLATGTPALTLREWARDNHHFGNKIEAKSQAHLLLLLRYFDATMRGERIDRVQYGRGTLMPVPYHPDGVQAAIENVRTALARYDAEAATP